MKLKYKPKYPMTFDKGKIKPMLIGETNIKPMTVDDWEIEKESNSSEEMQ